MSVVCALHGHHGSRCLKVLAAIKLEDAVLWKIRASYCLRFLYRISRVLRKAGSHLKENQDFRIYSLLERTWTPCQLFAVSGLEGAPGTCSKYAEPAHLCSVLSGLQCARVSRTKCCAKVGYTPLKPQGSQVKL